MRPNIIALLIATAAAPAIYAAAPAYVAAAVADPARPAADRDADARRLPAETIAFAGVKPGMTVGEFYPGGGYFTRLLAESSGRRATSTRVRT